MAEQVAFPQPPKSIEHALCAPSESLPPEWRPEEGFVPLTEEQLMAGLASVPMEWVPRDRAEQDPGFKQWIPYVVVRNAVGELAAYPRRGGESRLHGLWSLSIGGHVNPVDSGEVGRNGKSWMDALARGLRRELAEEFPAALSGHTRFLGLVHESRTLVGQVHLGAVFLHSIATRPERGGSELTGLRWLPESVPGTGVWPWERFELWSQLGVRLLRHSHQAPP